MTKEQMQDIGYHGALLDCYHYLRRYGGEVTDDETFWDAAAVEAQIIFKRYENTQAGALTIAMLLAVLDELERISRPEI